MLILSLDTASEWGGVAVFDDEREVTLVSNDGPADRYSVALFEMTDRALATAHIALHDVELIAAANGPGSFTGIRVGLAAAQAWCAAFSKPAFGVSVLEAMVEEARPTTHWAVPILDARRNEFYLGKYRPANLDSLGGDGAGEEWVVGAMELEDYLRQLRGAPSGDPCCIVRESDAKAQALRERAGEGHGIWKTVPNSILGAVARIALRRLRKSSQEGFTGLDARYIRRADAELNWRQP